VDIGFAIASIVRLPVPRVRMANGWALGKFGGESAQVTQTYVGQLQSGLFLRAYFTYTASGVRLWHKTDIAIALSDVRFRR
jgi:hypothetical protein